MSEQSSELVSLRRWKAEALSVMAGLQEVGHALGIPLGVSLTGRTALDAALDLRNAERERARAAVVDVLGPLMDQAWDSDRREVWSALCDARFALLGALGTSSKPPAQSTGADQ